MYEKSDSFDEVMTIYAQAAYQNPSEELDLTALFFPALKVGANTGKFDKYAWDPALTAVDTLLARDGAPRRIQMEKRKGFWDCDPHALEIVTFSPDTLQEDAATLREDKLRTLLSAQFVSRNVAAVNMVKGAIQPVNGLGAWTGAGNASKDVIAELKTLLRGVVTGCLRKPNKLVIGSQAWEVICNHASVKERVAGISLGCTPDALKTMLAYGALEIVIVDSAAIVDGTVTELLANDIIALYNEAAPTRSDLSFGKEFTLCPNGPEVLSYDERAINHSDLLMWSSDVQVTNPNAACRLVVS